MFRIVIAIALSSSLMACAGWITQQPVRHEPETAPDGSAFFTAYDLLGRSIESLHPDTCPLPPEELERLESNGYQIVNGFAKENDPPYGRYYPSYICIHFAGPGLMSGSLLVATTHEEEIIATEVSFRPPQSSTVESVFTDLEEYYVGQCSQCESGSQEDMTCLDCSSSARVDLAIDRTSAVNKVIVTYYASDTGLDELRQQDTGLGPAYYGF